MPVKHCCYGNCNSDSRYAEKRSDMKDVFFIPFPKPKTQQAKCERWLRLCGRKFFGVVNVRKETYICSKHFMNKEGPTADYPDPIPASATDLELKSMKKSKRKAPMQRHLSLTDVSVTVATATKEESSIMSVLTDHNYTYNTKSCSTTSSDRSDMPLNNDSSLLEMELVSPDQLDVITDIVVDDHEYDVDDDIKITEIESVVNVPDSVPLSCSTKTVKSTGSKTNIVFDDIKDYTDKVLKDTQQMKRHLFLGNVMKDDISCAFYTGLSISMFTLLLTWLSAKAVNLSYWRGQNTSETRNVQKPGPKRKLSIKEELILTLVRLRRGFDVEVISHLFGVHSSSVSRIFTTWINFLSIELSFLISWPTKEQVRANLPNQFKYFPKTRVIIDCTEFFVQKPSQPSYQRLTWSQYKHHNTFKALIGITPTGSFSFISNLYSGNISDKRIVEKSGFLNKIEYGDDVMADRGFLIRDLLATRYATLNIPPFCMGKQLSSKAVTKTRRIASARIHVERAIGRLKTYKLLQGIVPLKLHPLFDQIILVCAYLCNLDSRLVK